MTEKMNTWSGTHQLASLSFVHMIGTKIIPILKALLQGKFFIFKILFLVVVFLRFSTVVFLLELRNVSVKTNTSIYLTTRKRLTRQAGSR